jgi:hypothetical protein
MKKTKNKEFRLFEMVSKCPKCGSPIYACRIWDGVGDPPVKRTCYCSFYDWWTMPRTIDTWIPVYPWWQPIYGDSTGTAPDDYSITYHY